MELEMKDFPDFVGSRIDKFLSDALDGFSRSRVQGLIKSGDILVNGQRVKTGYTVSLNDLIYVREDTGVDDIVAEDLPIEIVHEDADFLIINKPAGMVVHPADGRHMSGTVVNAILDKVSIKGSDRPGIVHRLDKDTSGLMVIARLPEAYEQLVRLFKERKVKKTYLALVSGHLLHKQGVIDSPIGRDPKNRKKMAVITSGKTAVTQYQVLEEYKVENFDFSLVNVEIKTGRTHQIRVHFSSIGHPVVCDSAYGSRKVNKFFLDNYALDRQFLHASQLKFVFHAKKKALDFKSELPDDLALVLKQL